MISYREKELLMIQKMLQDDTNAMIENSLNLIKNADATPMHLNTTSNTFDSIDSYEDLVTLAKCRGYDTHIRAKDILSPEELLDIKKNKKKYEEQFNLETKLDSKDIGFLFGILILQIGKQLLIKFDFKDHDERPNANETDDDYHNKYDNESDIDDHTYAKRYYAPYDQIVNTAFVPYDIVKNTKTFENGRPTGLGLNGNNHRSKTVGHDPILGLIFGTANILTNTATFYANNTEPSGNLMNKKFRTIHVSYEDRTNYKGSFAKQNASTNLMLGHMIKRLKTDSKSVKAAFKKEIDHLASDETSIAGIPLPFISYVLGTEAAEKLTEDFDFLDLKNVAKTIGTQIVVAELINCIVGFLYRIYILWEEVKDADNWKEKLHIIFKEKLENFDEVKKRKIIMYSNLLASSLNLAVCAGGAAISSVFLENPELSKQFLEHLDIGGYFVSIKHLITDEYFILKVKKDFVTKCAENDFKKKIQMFDTTEIVQL